MQPTRRNILAALLPAATLPVTGFHPAGAQTRSVLDLTPECGKGSEPTMAQTEGPYLKPDAPLKRDFAVDAPNGERITSQVSSWTPTASLFQRRWFSFGMPMRPAPMTMPASG